MACSRRHQGSNSAGSRQLRSTVVVAVIAAVAKFTAAMNQKSPGC